MFPRSTFHYMRNDALPESQRTDDLFSWRPSELHDFNLASQRFGKSGIAVTFATGFFLQWHELSFCLPALLNHIRDIVGGCTRGKMIWVCAGWIIAVVQHIQRWPSSLVKKIRQAMRFYCSRFAFVSEQHSAVAKMLCVSAPSPAVALWALAWRFIDLGKKVLNLIVGKFRGIYINSRHDLSSFLVKIVSRPVASVSALARVVMFIVPQEAAYLPY